MPKKKLSSKQTRQSKSSRATSKQSAGRKVSPQKKYAQALKRIIKQQADTAGFKKKSAKEQKQIAQRVYREIGKKNPTKADISPALKQYKKAQAKTKIQVGEKKLDSKGVIAQALEELYRIPRNIITKREFDSKNMIVKITIKGKDYTRTIKGHIVQREGSKILRWKWETKTSKQ